MKKRNIMKGKKILGLALVGVFSFAMVTPVFAAAGGEGTNDSGTITVSYTSLTDVDSTSTISTINQVNGVEIDEDFGYAWDDLSFTYVQHINSLTTNTTTTNLTTAGFDSNVSSTSNTEETFDHGEWYYGSYSSLNDLDTTKVMPVKTLGDFANATPELQISQLVTADEYAALPKVVLHNYTASSANYAFSVSNSSAYNNNGRLAFVDSNRWADDPADISDTITSSETVTYGVLPIGDPQTKDFDSFTIGLTINFN